MSRRDPIRSNNVLVYAQHGASAVAASRHIVHDADHDMAAILFKVSAAVAMARKLMSMRRCTCLE
jgi:hypothetical protein